MIETGETFLNDAQILRFIQEKCGDDIARFMEKKLRSAALRAVSVGRIKQALDSLWNISLSDIEEDIERATRILETEVGHD